MTQARSPFHPGEIAVQRRAGVRDEAADVGRIISGAIPPAFGPLLAEFRFAVAGSIDRRGRVWASLLSGPPGFLRVQDESLLRIGTLPPSGDPLIDNLSRSSDLGLLVFDPATRRRLRFNGKGSLNGNGGLRLAVEQAYGNCRKYIQLRRLRTDGASAGRAAPIRATRLSEAQRARLAAADTFFIASAHPEAGADVSHRGGRPGFVRVDGDRSLSFPDYPGNNMFNTLGNLSVSPQAGLLFVDFEQGDLIQLSGRARLSWDGEAAGARRGAERIIVGLDIEEVIATPGGSPMRWDLVEPSPFNP